MSDELTITKKDAALIAEVVVLKLKRVLQEQISNVIEEELSPLLEEMVKSIASSYKSLNEIQNSMSLLSKRSPRTEEPSMVTEERGSRNSKQGFKKFLRTGETFGDQYAHAPNRHPRKVEDLREESLPQNDDWDDEDSEDEISAMLTINERLLEGEEREKRRLESQERFNRMSRTQTNEDQPKNIDHDSRAENGFVESFLNENAPAFAQRSRQRQRPPMGSVAPEREEDLMDEIIDDNVRQAMNESSPAYDSGDSYDSYNSYESPESFDPTASYDEFFIPSGINVSSVATPNMSQATRPATGPIRGHEVGFKGDGYDPIPPPEIA